MSVYLYAIVAGACQIDFGECGLPDDGQAHVTTVPGCGVSAVVSKYRGPAVADLSRASLLRFLAVHQRVGERAMAKRPMLPVKFGTVLATRAEVAAVMEGWQPRLSAALRELGDAVEVEVVATWDLQQTFTEISRQPEIVDLAAKAAGRPAEESLTTRIQVGRLVKESLDRRREDYRDRIVRELAPWARDVQANSIPADQMVANVALLVERAGLDCLYRQAHRLDEACDGRLTFRCVGPLPPHSFATVEITRPCVEQIVAARGVLCLGERTCEREVTTAYRRLASRCHPDLNPDDPSAAARFAALAAAHDQLLTYLRGQPVQADPSSAISIVGTVEEERTHDLSRAAVEKSLLLSIKRSGSGAIQTTERERGRDAAVA